jgi:hypothetical protein
MSVFFFLLIELCKRYRPIPQHWHLLLRLQLRFYSFFRRISRLSCKMVEITWRSLQSFREFRSSAQNLNLEQVTLCLTGAKWAYIWQLNLTIRHRLKNFLVLVGVGISDVSCLFLVATRSRFTPTQDGAQKLLFCHFIIKVLSRPQHPLDAPRELFLYPQTFQLQSSFCFRFWLSLNLR